MIRECHLCFGGVREIEGNRYRCDCPNGVSHRNLDKVPLALLMRPPSGRIKKVHGGSTETTYREPIEPRRPDPPQPRKPGRPKGSGKGQSVGRTYHY